MVDNCAVVWCAYLQEISGVFILYTIKKTDNISSLVIIFQYLLTLILCREREGYNPLIQAVVMSDEHGTARSEKRKKQQPGWERGLKNVKQIYIVE